MVSSIYTALAVLASVASALPQAPAAGQSCQQLGSGSQVDGYTITCNADRPGGDLSNAQSASFSGCFSLCDALKGCMGFAYSNGFCYFKNALEAQVSATNVDVAVKPSGQSCQQIGNGTQYDGYQVQCGIDHLGGDLTSAQAGSYSACFPICDANPQCVGFTYHGGDNAGTCYLKSTITPGSPSQDDDSAVKGSGNPSTTTTTAASTTPSTTTRSTTPVVPTTTTTKSTTLATTISAGFPIPTFPIPTFPIPTFPIPTFPIPTFPIPTPTMPTASPSPSPSSKFCTKYVFGVPVIVLCNTW